MPLTIWWKIVSDTPDTKELLEQYPNLSPEEAKVLLTAPIDIASVNQEIYASAVKKIQEIRN